MSDKLITLEDHEGPFQMVFKRVMRMVPERDKEDKKLQRLIAFRLRIDGEAKCTHTSSFYDFLKDDFPQTNCKASNQNSDPPGAA
jgi:hypothetical protein